MPQIWNRFKTSADDFFFRSRRIIKINIHWTFSQSTEHHCSESCYVNMIFYVHSFNPERPFVLTWNQKRFEVKKPGTSVKVYFVGVPHRVTSLESGVVLFVITFFRWLWLRTIEWQNSQKLDLAGFEPMTFQS